MLHTALFLLRVPPPFPPTYKAATETLKVQISTSAIRDLVLAERVVRGIHLTCWGAGSSKTRKSSSEDLGFRDQYGSDSWRRNGRESLYPRRGKSVQVRLHQSAITDPAAMLKDFKAASLYTVARIVVSRTK